MEISGNGTEISEACNKLATLTDFDVKASECSEYLAEHPDATGQDVIDYYTLEQDEAYKDFVESRLISNDVLK